MLDVNPDEAIDMAKKQRMLHWDSRKKKFVKTTLRELGEGKKGRKIRTESGELREHSSPERGVGRTRRGDSLSSLLCS